MRWILVKACDCEEEMDRPIVEVDVSDRRNEQEHDEMCVENGASAMLQRAKERCCKANGKGCSQIKEPSPAQQLKEILL